MSSRHTSSSQAFFGQVSGSLLSLKTAAIFLATVACSFALEIVSLSPPDGGTGPAGELSLQIVFDDPVAVGSGTLEVIDAIDFTTVVASFDVSNPDNYTISGNTVTFTSFTAVDGSFLGVNAPAGLFMSFGDGSDSPFISVNGDGDATWFFDVVAADTTGPAIVGLSPSGPGSSNSSTLTATYDENVSFGPGPWTIEVFDVTAGQVLQSFSEADAGIAVTALGNDLSISLNDALAFNNDYRVTASAGVVQDAAGNLSGAIASGVWEFTTGDPFTAGQVVISQVHGGGGNGGAIFTNDFVELHNRTGVGYLTRRLVSAKYSAQ